MTTRTALVTGGTGAIGLATCIELARAGHRVVSTCLESERESADEFHRRMKAEGLEGDVVFCDVSDWDDAQRCIREVEDKHGPVDILVNCAGITADGFFHKMSIEQWRRVLNINLDSMFHMTRPVIEGMRERGWGRVINISSMNGQTGQIGQANYSASKAGVHGFTMALAKETARKGITVNTVSPGYVASRLTLAVDDKIREGIVAQVPAGRMGRPEEIAAAIAFLASEPASYVTGVNLPVNGGLFVSF